MTLLRRDAAVARQVHEQAPETLSWAFDPRPGYEHAHDRVLDIVLPLLLPFHPNDDLYSYQRRGVAWLLGRQRAILADDMGLGKTIQILAAVRRLIRWGEIQSCLVVAPRTLLDNWMTEGAQWTPELVTRRLPQAGDRERPGAWRGTVARAHIVLATYEEVRDVSQEMTDHPPDLIIADEAHRLRKADSQALRGLRRMNSPRLWMATGTPVERDADDLACLLATLEPRKYADRDARLGIDSLRARARPLLLRRTKEEVLPELPRPHEVTISVQLSRSQRCTYEDAIRSFVHEGGSGYLPLFTKLRQICDIDPDSGHSSKLDVAIDLMNEVAAIGDKVVVFSYTLAPLRALQSRVRHSSLYGAQLLTGEMTLSQRRDALAIFRHEDSCVALLASTRVGGEGLTLTEANHVIFINRWWNPSSNNQAIDRVVRIGQQNPVTVNYLACKDTVEDRLQPMLDRKQITFSQLIDRLQVDPASIEALFHYDHEIQEGDEDGSEEHGI